MPERIMPNNAAASLVFRILAFVSLTFVSTERAAADKSVPNVLLITSEDNGPELGCYGDPFVRTPHLDRLATQGVRFERAFVATASCSESRAALLTGLYPHQNGQIGLASHHYRMFGKLPNIASRLKKRGYRTGIIGKLHVNPESAFPFDYRPSVSRSNTFSHRDVKRVAELASEFFTAADAPFFLMVNYADAHLPFLRQQQGLPQSPLSADDVRPLPWIGIDNPRVRESQANYYNCIMRMDEGVGRLLAALDKADRTKDTLVIYLGDHGAQFPRGKLASYESSLQVPLIVRFPGRIPTGKVRKELVSSLDLLPTILESVGSQSAPELPGRSLLPLMNQREGDWRDFLFTEYHGHYPPLYFPQRTVSDGRYKLIVNLLQDRVNPVAMTCSQMDRPPHPPYVTASDVSAAQEDVQQAYTTWRDAPPVELYDLQTDPHEWRNLADAPSLANVRTRLLAELRRWQKQTNDPLSDRAKLARLTSEHDALAKPYRRPKVSPWKYTDYLTTAIQQSVAQTSKPKTLTKGGVVMTFDDRNFGDWVKAIPLFDEFGVKATFFINGDIDAAALGAIQILQSHGHVIGSHSVNHLKAVEYCEGKSTDEFLRHEIQPQLRQLNSGGVSPSSFAYPMSRNNEITDKALLTLFRHVRTGRNIREGERISEDEIFFVHADEIQIHGCLYAKNIDRAPERADCTFEQIDAALTRAASRKEVIVLYAHRISESGKGNFVTPTALARVFGKAKALGLEFYTFDQLP